MFIIEFVQAMFTSFVSISALLYVWHKVRQHRKAKVVTRRQRLI